MTPPVPPLRTHAAPVVQQAPLLSVSPPINLHDAVQALLESDDEHHRSFVDRHRVLSFDVYTVGPCKPPFSTTLIISNLYFKRNWTDSSSDLQLFNKRRFYL